jgi:NAD kinase
MRCRPMAAASTEVLVAQKITPYEHEKAEGTAEEEIAPSVREGHESHRESVGYIEEILEDASLSYDTLKVTDVPEKFGKSYEALEEKFQDQGLVVSAGGDGTVLSVSHYTDDTPVLPVNTDYCLEAGEGSRGALVDFKASEFDDVIDNYLQGDLDMEAWTRVEADFGDEMLRGLNEVFFGAEFNQDASSYTVERGSVSERHEGSGFIVSTGTGSTAWYSSILGNDEVFSRTSGELRFVARELDDYYLDYSLETGSLRPEEDLEITSQNNKGSVVSVDGKEGRSSRKLSKGESVRVSRAGQPLNVFVKWLEKP